MPTCVTDRRIVLAFLNMVVVQPGGVLGPGTDRQTDRQTDDSIMPITWMTDRSIVLAFLNMVVVQPGGELGPGTDRQTDNSTMPITE